MPLVIERSVGQDFYVGDKRFVVTAIDGANAFTVQREHDGEAFHVVLGTPREVAASVIVAVGTRGQNTLARISIEAPQSIRVLRGELYRSSS